MRAPPADSRPWPWSLFPGVTVLCIQLCCSLCSAERAPSSLMAPSRCSMGKGRELGASHLLLPVQWEHSLATPPSSALWPSALFKLASSDVSSVVTTFPASVNANPLGPAPCSVSRCQPVHVTIKATLSPRSSSPKPPHQHAPTVGATAVHLEDGQALALLLPAGAPPFSRAPTRSQVPVLSRTWTCTLRPSVLHLHLA